MTDRDPVKSSGTLALARFAPRLLAGAIFAVVVISGVLLLSDTRGLASALREFRWPLLLPALALTIWNYALRFLKWQLYLRRLGIRSLPPTVSLLVFLSAFALSITPGKVGEFVKCAFINRLTGFPASRTTAAVVAERLTDGLAMILLAATGTLLFPLGRPVLALAALVALGAVLLLQRPDRVAAMLHRLPSRPTSDRLLSHARQFLDASGSLVAPRFLAAGVGLGVIAWLGECAALFLILIGLGVPASAELFLVATFVLAVSSLAGALSMLPGGLGVTEASVAAMLLVLVPDAYLDPSQALVATLLIRFATLWFAVLLGAGSLLLLRPHLRSSPFRDEDDADQSHIVRQTERDVPPISVAQVGGNR